jgi:alanine dehydrogenase
MLIGVPKEIKNREYRVGLVPASIRELISRGHHVLVETDAGAGIGITDDMYREAGAELAPDAPSIFAKADMIVKVKEPQPQECKLLRENQVLFTYLHLAPDPEQAKLLLESGAICIAYETVTANDGQLPLLTPMSQVAGRMSIQAGAHCLEKASGGKGVLLGGVPGVAPANVVVLGGGVVGTNAVRMAMGTEAFVTVLDISLSRLQQLDLQFGSKLNTIYATRESIEQYVREADLVIGAVLVPGAAAPVLVTHKMIREMQKGSVVVDVAIDQGGCFETSRPTTHDQPTYVVDDVVHYCVTNMPGGVPRTATFALNNATLPFIVELADKGYKRAMLDNPHLRNGLNIHRGKITYPAVAEALRQSYVPAASLLDS